MSIAKAKKPPGPSAITDGTATALGRGATGQGPSKMRRATGMSQALVPANSSLALHHPTSTRR